MVFCNEGDAMKLAIGCDEAACDLKNAVKQHLLAQGHEVADFGTHDGEPVLYPDIGIAVAQAIVQGDRKSTRLNSSHVRISYAVFCLKKKKTLIKRSNSSIFSC